MENGLSVEHGVADKDERAVLRDMIAKQEITEVLYRYSRGCDRADEDMLHSCFHSDSTHKHGAFEGLSAEFCGYAMEVVRPLKACSHMISNMLIEIRGETAISECHFFAHQRRDSAETGEEEDRFLKGRYLDRFEKRGGVWKIAHRTGLHDFERVVPPADQTLAGAPPDQLSRQRPDDPIYGMLDAL